MFRCNFAVTSLHLFLNVSIVQLLTTLLVLMALILTSSENFLERKKIIKTKHQKPSMNWTTCIPSLFNVCCSFGECKKSSIIFSVRKGTDGLKKALEIVVVPMFCSASLDATEDQQGKLNKVWSFACFLFKASYLLVEESGKFTWFHLT